MRLCLELGLHRPKPYQAHQVRSEQQRRKIFWSVYIFERKSALVLGRPFAVSDKDITISVPDSDYEEDAPPSDSLSTVLLRNYVLLYRIHSKIRSTLHHLRSEAPCAKVADKVASCLQKLEDWKTRMLHEVDLRTNDTSSASRRATTRSHSDSSDSAEDTPVSLKRYPGQDKAELLLEYHKARRSLMQPLLTDGGSKYSPTLADYSACVDASGQICQQYRLLHRLSALPFTLRDLHAVLIAGFTWLHCIAARPVLYNAYNAGKIGACSTVLYLIAEQWSGAKTYRDTFEIVAEKLIAKVSETQSESRGCYAEPIATTGDVSAGFSSNSRRHQPHHRSSSSSEPSGGTSLPLAGPSQPSDPYATHLYQDMVPNRVSTGSHGGNELDLSSMFGNIVEDSFASFNVEYPDDSLRELLANEGFDWFSKE